MGRKVNYVEKTRKGPGRKSKKQKDPVFNKTIKPANDEAESKKKLSHKQVKRAKKRDGIKLKNRENQIMKQSQAATKAKKLQAADSVESNSDEDDTMDSDAEEKGLVRNKRSNINELLGDSDNDDSEGIHDSNSSNTEFSSDDDNEEKLPIEAANKKLKRKIAKESKLADDEMKSIAMNKERFEFPNEEQLQQSNLQEINIRIKEVIGVLSDFIVNREPEHSRSQYMDLLKQDLCVYYSYNDFMMQTLIDLFSPNELLEFLEASEIQRPLTIRTNGLKIRRRDLAQSLINRGVNLDPIGKWSKEGLVVYSSQVPLGATPEYLAGYYMIQGASSMLPVIALSPEENERILDMCAAPGGKSSHIAALMKNTGVVFANDVNNERLQAVVGNFHRLGIVNTIVTNIDGRKYSEFMTGFDRVLLDAPCTGTGVISKDPNVKASKSDVDVQKCYNLQRKLLLTAIDCLSAKSKTGGFIVYSTCSILPQENEWVIDYAIKKRNVRLVSTGLDFGSEGYTSYRGYKYHPSMKLTRRFYPHTFNMDGFFVAKLQKFSDAIPKSIEVETDDVVDEEVVDETVLPKKIDKRDWFYKDIIDKRKKKRQDTNHVLTVFEKPQKNDK